MYHIFENSNSSDKYFHSPPSPDLRPAGSDIVDTIEMDLSSFPLLRIDQLADHNDNTLFEAEKQLVVMAGEQGGQQALTSFITKLLLSIRRERARRRQAAEDSKPRRLQSPKKGSSTATAFFVTSNSPSVGKNSFKTRMAMRQQALSRSREAEHKERLILGKKQARHAKLRAWREEREAAKNQREALLQMEREVRRTKRAEKEKKEELLLAEMQKAADDARAAILVSGCSDLVKAAEIAAEAAAKVIDDGSASSDDDDGSSVESDADEGSCKVTAQVSSPGGEKDVLETETEREEGVHNNVADVACRSVDDAEDEPSSVASEEEQAIGVPDSDQLQSGQINDADDCEDDDTDRKAAFVGGVETDTQAQPEALPDEVCLKKPDRSEEIDVARQEPTQSPTPRNPTQKHRHDHNHRPRKQDRASPRHSDIFTSVACGAKDLLSHECAVFTQNYEKSRLAFASSLEPIDDSDDDESSGSELDTFDRGLFYKVKSRRSDVSLVISRAFAHQSLAATWRELPDQIEESSWNLLWVWGMPKRADFDNLLSFQKVNR